MTQIGGLYVRTGILEKRIFGIQNLKDSNRKHQFIWS